MSFGLPVGELVDWEAFLSRMYCFIWLLTILGLVEGNNETEHGSGNEEGRDERDGWGDDERKESLRLRWATF